MAANNIPFSTITMTNKGSAKENETAQQVAGLFKAEWNPTIVDPPTGKDFYSLLKLKEGMNNLSTATLLPFYVQLQKKYGYNINFITGDRGDKMILQYDNPIKKCSNIHDLLNYILDEHSAINIDEVCLLVNIHKDDLLNGIIELLKSFPEQSYSQKYIHLRAIEKSHKLAFQGEDRLRKYFWTYSLLTSIPFVLYLFNCSDKAKKMHKLFVALLESYSKEAANITYVNYKSPLISIRAKLFMAGVYYIYPRTNYKIRSNKKNIFFAHNLINKESLFYKCIDEQLKNNTNISDHLKIKESSQLGNFHLNTLLSIFTLTSLIDDLYSKDCILKKYFTDEFIYAN
jgi:hypothetical protein